MVQSIWLDIEKKQCKKEIVDKIVKIIKNKYKCYSYIDNKKEHTYRFHFIDCNQIKEIIDKLKLKVDDKKECDCGCFSTDFERLVYFIDLEFNYGKITPKEVPVQCSYFQIGRNVWGSVGMYKERLNTIRFILEHLKKEFDKEGIGCKIDLGDCEIEYFEGYFPLSVKNNNEVEVG